MAKDLADAQRIYSSDMRDLATVVDMLRFKILGTNLGNRPDSLNDYEYKRKEIVWRLKDARKLISNVIGDGY